MIPSGQPRLRRPDLPRLAQAVASLVAQNVPAEVYGQRLVRVGALASTPLAGYVTWAWVTRMREPEQAAWAAEDTRFVSVTANEVQARLCHKEAKLPGYRRYCAQVGLLIVASGDSPGLSTFAALDQPEMRDHEYASGFDRAFFYDAVHQEVVRLRVRPGA